MKKIYLFVAAALLTLTGCDLDINENPNYPSDTDVSDAMVFPAAENAIADVFGDAAFNYGGFFAQFFEQRPESNQYNNLCEYNIQEATDIFTRPYAIIYSRALEDLDIICNRSTNPANVYAAKVMRAIAFQFLVDNTSDTPYTEALQGTTNAQPKYDDGETVYKGVLDELDKAEANLTSESMTFNDPVFNKDITQWKGLANALRLRMYLRMIDGGIDADSYTAKVKELIAKNEFFTGDAQWDVYSDADGQWNPWYDSYHTLGAANHVAAYPIVSYYLANNDPRISFAIKKNTKNNAYVGQIPGAKTMYQSWTGSQWKNVEVSDIDYTKANHMAIPYFTQSELQFLIAECQLRFNNDAAAAKTAYEKAVKLDFEWRGIDGADDFLAQDGVNFDKQKTTEDKLDLIYMQKWAALFYRDHMEAWSEIRRTDVPKTSPLTAKEVYTNPDKYTPGDMIIPALNTFGNNQLIKRLPYSSTSRRLNPNTPPVKAISDRVFWDAK